MTRESNRRSPVDTSNVNSYWAGVFADELASSGVDTVCLSPGSRNTPLTVALHEQDGIRVLSHLDERASAFFALGRSRVTGTPTALVCTSGSAAAEYHPAVLESHHDRVPLLVLTADRPPELTDSGANQTVEQSDLYGSATRWSRTLPEPEDNPRKIRSLRTTLCRAVHRAESSPAGPVHLNLPFRKPLEPSDRPDPRLAAFAEEHPLETRGRSGPFVNLENNPVPAGPLPGGIADELASAEKPLLHLGPLRGNEPRRTPKVLEDLRALPLPVLVNPRSGCRFHPGVGEADPVAGYDGFLPALESRPGWIPDLVVHVGAAPNASNGWMDYLKRTAADRILVSPRGEWPEDDFRAHRRVELDAGRFLDALVEHPTDLSASPAWRKRWERVEQRWWSYLEESLPGEDPDPFEGQVVRDLLELLPDPVRLYAGNSTPIRDFLRYAPPTEKRVHLAANRGTSGVDGQISTVAGMASAADEPVVGVVGDVGFYHDLNGLLGFSRHDLEGVLVLINNNGGGIFHQLPIESIDPPFRDYVKTPHGLDFEHAARLFDASFRSVNSRPAFRDDLEEALGEPGLSVVEVQTDAEASQRRRESLVEEFRSRLEGRSQPE